MSKDSQTMMKWEGFVPGDLVIYKGSRRLIYRGYYRGGPGHLGMDSEPAFGLDHPVNPDHVYFLRKIGGLYPAHSFSEDLPPKPAFGAMIGFLNGGRENFEKVGHVTPEQWEQMKRDIIVELEGEE